jgi:YD repeat-containing protein
LDSINFTDDSRGNKVYEENPSSAKSYTHDALGRVTSVTDEILGKVISYEFDQDGNRSKMLGPDGCSVQLFLST